MKKNIRLKQSDNQKQKGSRKNDHGEQSKE